MSTHQAAYDALAALVTADTGATGLNNTASLNHLWGGFTRVGDPERVRVLPFIEFEVAGEREQDAMSTNRADMVVRLHLFTDRNVMYRTTLQGNQNTLVTRMRAVFHGVTPSTSGGWNFNKIYRTSAVQAASSETEGHWVETYLLRLSA